jgi:hypothetical protein
VHNQRILLVLTLIFSLSGVSRRSFAAAAGKTALPTNEDSIEQDLDEDDRSFDPSLSDEKINASDNPDHDADSILSAPASPSQAAPTVDEPKEYSAPTIGESTHEEYDSSKSEKIFDWSKHQGETEVKHPFAEKGLQRITKDRTYFYKVGESDQKSAVSVHAGMFDPTELSNPDTPDSPYASFEANYDQSSNPAILFEYEWQLWRTPIGKFGVRLGSGIFVAQGHGHFVHDYNEVEPRETFTFMMFPNTVGAVYRFHMFHKQLFVPYVEGGGVAFAFTELRDDDKGPKFGGALGAYGAGGVGINLTYFDYMSRTQLDREYGINACYLTLEYRRFQAVTTRYDFTSDYLNGGFLMEY